MIKDIVMVIKKDKRAKISVIILISLVLLSIFAFLSPYDPNGININDRLQEPSLKHLFGTDDMGRDYLTRALYGGRVSLSVGFCSMIISCVIGTLVGTISGYFGGWIDSFIMRSLDILMCIPSFFIILILNIYFKPGLRTIIIIISLFSWMNIARIVRSETLSIKERDYVICAESQGIREYRIITKHIIPNIMNTVIVASTINVAGAIITESSLSFLGLGVQAPTSSWGSMLQNAQSQMMDRPTLAIFPGLLILITVLSFNMLGDRLRENISM
ncbi:oligopeptide ABC transporter permease [Clostridium fallax]|uniref:Peptide/nickel transport system permease protein n=2 Tax=Clostridium fallax TaxID=1533 RepID=A0A1M4SHE4_9CLOT|nr:ABC transporter permease [Clostridium fallax]SHE31606.1 peptide/nickel transport system permease protein [Clostridium fallax]SQB07831.1 oligopeptide ABC transporter permease [Clostridium fallax]